MTLIEIRQNIEKLGLLSTGLFQGEKKLISYCRQDKSNLDKIMDMVPSLPPGVYEIRARKTNANDPVIYQVDTRDRRLFGEQDTNVSQDHSRIGTKNLSDNQVQKLGQLEAKVEYLETMLADRDATIESLNQTIDMLESELELLENAEPNPGSLQDQPLQPKSMQDVLVESLAPVIPSLADKVLTWLDKQVTPGQTAPPPVATAPAPAQPMEIDYDRLAQTILKHGNAEFENAPAGM